MAPPSTNHWKNDKRYNELLNFIIKQTENVESPMTVLQLVNDFKKKSGDAQTETCLRHRVYKIRTVIHRIEHIDTNTKVKVLFALSAPVNEAFLKELRVDALVKVDEKKRITHFKANDGSLELKGGHSFFEKGSSINKYFANKNNVDAVSKKKDGTETGKLIQLITEKCENANSLLNITQLTRDFNKLSGSSRSFFCIKKRLRRYCHEIQKAELLDTPSKDAVVEVDELNRITKYTANNGRLTLHGDHSKSAKNRTAQLASKRTLRSLINRCLEKKKDAVAENDEEKEMWNFIEFITEKCVNVDKPLSIRQLTDDFNNHFGTSRSFFCIYKRVKSYCREVQKTEFLDIHSKVKQLFCLGATLDSEFLKELRKDASVEEDELNRITKYTANNGHLTLNGDHSQSAKNKSSWIVRKKNKRKVRKHCISGGDKDEDSEEEDGYSEDDSDEYSGEEFGSEFDSDDDDDPLDEPDQMDSSIVVHEFDDKTPANNRSPTDMAIDNNFDFDLPTERTPRLEETELGEDEKKDNDSEITGNASVKTRYGRLSKRRNLDSEFSAMKHSNSGGDENEESEKQNGHSGEDSGEYSSEEFDSDFDSDDENDALVETKDLMEPSNKAVEFDNETPVSNRSPTDMSIYDTFDFDPSPEKSHISEEIEMGEDEGKENDTGVIGNVRIKKSYERSSKRRYSDSEDDSDSHPNDSDDKNDDLNKTQDLMEISNDAYNSDNETSVKCLAPSGISIDNNFDFNAPTGKSHAPEETEMREDDEKDDPEITENEAVQSQRSEILTKNKISSSTSHTPKTPKRKADESAGSRTLKRTKPLPEESMNPGEMNDNSSHDEQPRIELNPVRGPLGLPNETRKDAGIQQIPKPRPQVMEAPIKKEYEEEAQTSLKTVLNAYKSLILSLDTPGLSQFLMDVDNKILETGSGAEISNKEVIMAMDFLIVKLSKHGALKSSEDSISLRDVFLMLRTIILNSSFNGLEVILEMLKENIEQLKVLDKKVPVSKVKCVLRATLDSIST